MQIFYLLPCTLQVNYFNFECMQSCISYPKIWMTLINYLIGMAANPIVVAKANQLFPEINFGFMTWIQGSIVPSIFCAICIPLIIRWSLGLNTDTPARGKHARGGENVIQHAQMELHKMGPVSIKEWVSL